MLLGNIFCDAGGIHFDRNIRLRYRTQPPLICPSWKLYPHHQHRCYHSLLRCDWQICGTDNRNDRSRFGPCCDIHVPSEDLSSLYYLYFYCCFCSVANRCNRIRNSLFNLGSVDWRRSFSIDLAMLAILFLELHPCGNRTIEGRRRFSIRQEISLPNPSVGSISRIAIPDILVWISGIHPIQCLRNRAS